LVDTKTRSLLLLILGVLITSVIVVSYLLRQPHSAPAINGVLIQQTQSLPNFTLIDHQQHEFTKDNLRGRWHFIAYGYTHCPDICPVTLSILSSLIKRLGHDLTDTGVIFYSVDPQRDTPQHLAKYVPYFHQDFIGVTYAQTADSHLAFEKGLGIVYELPSSDAQGNAYDEANYPVNHGTTIYLLNPSGNLQAIFTPDFDDNGMLVFSAELLYADYLAIRAYLDKHQIL
jgi:protein SCO1/2